METKDHVEILLSKASQAREPDAAMKFAQAALNAAHAITAKGPRRDDAPRT